MSVACPRCGGLLREDRQFTVEMAAYGMPQRRSVCMAGHSLTVHVPSVDGTPRARSAMARQPARTLRICAWCGDEFSGTRRQKYCSTPCVRAVDTARTAARLAGLRSGYTADALQQARAIQYPPKSPTPVAYARRAKSVSRTWA